MNMIDWADDLLSSKTKKVFPLMPYLELQLTGKKILEAVGDSHVQSQCVKAVASRFPSIECEAFGGTLRFVKNEVPATQLGLFQVFQNKYQMYAAQ
jgi:hypothetical protein